MMPGSSQGQGPNNQGSALGMNSLHVRPVGSPTMNGMEGGGEQRVERTTGAAGNSSTGTAMQGNTQAAVGTGTAATQAAPGLVGQAGSLVGSGHMLPPAMSTFGSYGPMRGILMDPRNYGLNQVFWDVKVMDVVVVLHVKGIQVRVCMDKVCWDKVSSDKVKEDKV